MRLRHLAPFVVVLALAGCSKASDIAANPTNSNSSTTSANPSGQPATGDDLAAITAAATRFVRASTLADWKTVCEMSVDKTGKIVTDVTGCANNYATQTKSAESWAKLTKAKQDEITANTATIQYTGTPSISGDIATTGGNYNYKGEARTDGPSLTLKKINGTWYVDTNKMSANPSPSASASK